MDMSKFSAYILFILYITTINHAALPGNAETTLRNTNISDITTSSTTPIPTSTIHNLSRVQEKEKNDTLGKKLKAVTKEHEEDTNTEPFYDAQEEKKPTNLTKPLSDGKPIGPNKNEQKTETIEDQKINDYKNVGDDEEESNMTNEYGDGDDGLEDENAPSIPREVDEDVKIGDMEQKDATEKIDNAKSTTSSSSSSSHLMTTIVIVILLVALSYVVYHNRQKILGYIVEGRHSKRSRRRTTSYKKLPTGEETLSQPDDDRSSKSYIY